MQDISPWPADADVSEPVARVLVDGKSFAVSQLTVSSELSSAVPAQVAVAGDGIVAATGEVSFLPDRDVAEARFNPWGEAAPLVEAAEIVVEAGYRHPVTGESCMARQITGQLESLDGQVRSTEAGMGFVDYTPVLDRNITIEPLLWEYPPVEDFGPKRGDGLRSIYVTDRVLRHCGFYATPPPLSGALLSATLMGSTVPERGTMYAAEADSLSSASATYLPTPWGVGLGNASVVYHPDWRSRGDGRLNETLHVSFLRRASVAADPNDVRIELRWGSANDAIRINAMGNGTVVVRYRNGGASTVVATMPASDVNASEAFTVLVSPSGTATIHASNGASVSGQAPLPPRVTSTHISEVYVRVPQASHPIGGLQVAFQSRTINSFRRNALIDPPDQLYTIAAFPAQIDVNCLDLLKDQARAEFAAIWIDEQGNFRWRNNSLLQSSQPQGTLTATDHLLDLPWEVPARSVYSRVEVENDHPTVARRVVPSITVSDSRGQILGNGETQTQFFEPPADQDWHQVDTPQWMGGSVEYWNVRRGRGSYRGGVIVDDDNNERLAYSTRLQQTWQQINPQRWALTSTAQNLSQDEFIEQNFRDRPELYGKFAGDGLPLIRARGLVEWEKTITTGAARGPRLAPVFTHQVGPWVQSPNDLQDMADWLAEQLTSPHVILRNIPIVPDPRIQLGDVFWLEDQTAYHVRLRILVMGKTLTYQARDAGVEMSQEITCRVIEVDRQQVRYDELETTWAGRDYEALESAWAGRDYAALEADPLERN